MGEMDRGGKHHGIIIGFIDSLLRDFLTRIDTEYHIRVKVRTSFGDEFNYTFRNDEDLKMSIPVIDKSVSGQPGSMDNEVSAQTNWATIGPEGGIVALSASGNYLGTPAKVVIPPAALPTETEIVISNSGIPDNYRKNDSGSIRSKKFPLIEDLNITMFAREATEHGVIILLKGDSPALFGDFFFKIFLAFITHPSIAF
jgi:hypothetical protein